MAGHATRGYVVLLDSWEKLTWATLGLVRLMHMTKAAGLSLVEPCVSQGGIGGFGDVSKFQLEAYFDTHALRIQAGTVTVSEFASVAERGQGEEWIFDTLLVFLWWQEEQRHVRFEPSSGLADCTSTLSDILGASVTPLPLHDGNPEQLYTISKLNDGTGNPIWTQHLAFRRILCADPDSLSRRGSAFDSPGDWLANAHGGKGGRVAMARYRRTALTRKGAEEWGRWEEDEEGLKAVRLAPQLQAALEDFRDESLGGERYVGVHLRGGRVWNKAGVEGGQYVRQRHTAECVRGLMVQTLECAERLAARAEALVASREVTGVYVASDLRQQDMPEMQTPAMDPPYVTVEERGSLLAVMGEARHVLLDALEGVSFPSHTLPDPVGMGALIDAELLGGAEVFVHAGQQPGKCEPTGYGESIVRKRRDKGLENATTEYIGDCCVPGC